MWGVSTFSMAMVLLKWLPLKLVDKFLLLVANFKFGNTARLGLRLPKFGPLELKNATEKSPVLDVGALSLIKSGKIEVVEGVKEIMKNGAKFCDGQERDFDFIILETPHISVSPSPLSLSLPDSLFLSPLLTDRNKGSRPKRVSIAHEMLVDPSLLILDEPTSGLDATAAYRPMAALGGLAARGKTVVMSVHQLSSRAYQMFDDLGY
ncbi:probable indole-3-pyruvate monooxygenase YUCCA1 [Salvia miltiorrhiza]|uniref:probable indole-3-pyruvate monooxygenase YUCCA1 n=1 Tax=Salvia miltiorrhiza TaxID=226208 RepID=UPI0025AD06EE|nr:probable indole-3-pyruvate monooxygenase YUCCA1 [Salvia miltiorrhiza]